MLIKTYTDLTYSIMFIMISQDVCKTGYTIQRFHIV